MVLASGLCSIGSFLLGRARSVGHCGGIQLFLTMHLGLTLRSKLLPSVARTPQKRGAFYLNLQGLPLKSSE